MWRDTDYITSVLVEGDADINNLNYKKEWDALVNSKIYSGDYSKSPFLVRSATLFPEIMPLACKLCLWLATSDSMSAS